MQTNRGGGEDSALIECLLSKTPRGREREEEEEEEEEQEEREEEEREEKEEKEIKRRTSACSQWPPCLDRGGGLEAAAVEEHAAALVAEPRGVHHLVVGLREDGHHRVGHASE